LLHASSPQFHIDDVNNDENDKALVYGTQGWKTVVFRKVLGFLYEDETRKYDPNAHEKYPIHGTPFSFHGLQHTKLTTTSITLAGYKQ